MSSLFAFASRCKGLFQARRRNAEMAEELRHHLALRAERNLAGGMTPRDAHDAALRQFGHVEGIKERCREQWSLPRLELLVRDLRSAVRMLRRHPGFALATVLTLAFGLGAATAIFSVVSHVVLQPLPFPESDRLVSLFETTPDSSVPTPVSVAMFLAWRKQATLLQESALTANIPLLVTGAGEPRRCFGLVVTPHYFPVLGVRPLLGRVFAPGEGPRLNRVFASRGETEPGGDAVVLNHKFWLSQFGGRSDIIGRKITVNGHTYTVVGVMPQNFLPEKMTDPALFLPTSETDFDAAVLWRHFPGAIARLKPRVTLAQASQQLDAIARALAARYPAAAGGRGVKVVPLLDAQVGGVRPLLLTLFGAVGFLLLVVCVNVANLFVARGNSRQKEIAVRLALGASRGRIVRQLVCESLLLSFLGSTLGFALAYGSMHWLLRLGPLTLPRSQEIAIDGQAFFFASLLTLLVGVGVGLLPALQATRVHLTTMMKEGAHAAGEVRRRLRLRGALVVFQVFLALVLLLGTGLLGRSFHRLRRVSLGFDPGTGVMLVAKPLLTGERYAALPPIAALADQAMTRLAAVPGVESAAFGTTAPFCYETKCAVTIEGGPASDRTIGYCAAAPSYFETLRIPRVSGRGFDARDRPGSGAVAIVSENFVRKYFPGADPLGKRFRITGTTAWQEIVGVVADVRSHGPAQPAPLQVYLPFAQHPEHMPLLIIRLKSADVDVRATLRATLDTIDPDWPMPELSTPIDLFLDDSIAAERLALCLFAIFSAAALLLSAFGLYGIVAYAVTQRTHEIGVRLALGAQARDILQLLFRRAGPTAGLGLMLGVVAALVVPHWLDSLLFERDPFDLPTLAGAVALLGMVVLIACWIPARRATKVDPLVALHCE